MAVNEEEDDCVALLEATSMRFNLGIIEPGVPYQGVSFYLEISQQSYSNIEGANRERTVQIAKGGVLPVYYRCTIGLRNYSSPPLNVVNLLTFCFQL